MNTDNIILPTGRTIAETKAYSEAHSEQLYMDTWAKGNYIVYFDDRCKIGEAIKANPDGSEDLLGVDDHGKETIIKRLNEAGKGKYAYLLNRKDYHTLKKHLSHA